MASRKFSADMVRSLLRWDMTWDEFWGAKGPSLRYSAESCRPTIDDLKALISNIRNRDPDMQRLYSEWGRLFGNGIFEVLSKTRDIDECEVTELHECLEFDDGHGWNPDFLESAFDAIWELSASTGYSSYTADSGIFDWKAIEREIALAERGELDEVSWRWTDITKLRAMEESLAGCFSFSTDELDDARKAIADMERRGIEEVHHVIAYGSYGGSMLLPCNWELSRDSFLKLLSSDTVDGMRKAEYSNSIAYIYYNGRCTDGNPDYASALKYFLVGAAFGIEKSRYRIADMLRSGKGMPVNREAGNRIIRETYGSAREKYQGDIFLDYTSFPDLALRMSSILKEEGRLYEALRTLREGECVLEGRDAYGDDRVKKAFAERIADFRGMETRPSRLVELFYPMEQMLEGKGSLKCWVHNRSDGSIDLEIRKSGKPRRVFLVLGEEVAVSTTVVYRVRNQKRMKVRGNLPCFCFESFDHAPGRKGSDRMSLSFVLGDDETCYIEDAEVTLVIPEELL